MTYTFEEIKRMMEEVFLLGRYYDLLDPKSDTAMAIRNQVAVWKKQIAGYYTTNPGD